MFLLDTMVISETRKRSPNKAVSGWVASTAVEDMFVSTMSFGELVAGALKVRGSDPQYHDALLHWIDVTKSLYRDRTLAVTTEVAEQWGNLYARLGRKDMDVLIGATALAHDLTLVTRNTRHFEVMGVRLFNPYDA